MKIIFNLSFIIFLLFACAPIPSVIPTATKSSQPEITLESATPVPTKTLIPAFTSTPTLTPFPTLDDFYYSTPSMFGLVSIKMFDESSGWGWASNYDGRLYRPVRTLDGGKSWVDVTPVERFGVTRDFFLDSKTAWISNVWAQINTWFLYFTNNGGLSWKTLSVPPEGINSLYFIDPTNGWATSGSYGSYILYHTTDGGQTWSEFLADSPVAGNEFLVRETANIWTSDYFAAISASKYLYVTWDRGKTWEAKDVHFKHEFFSNANLHGKVNLPVFFGDQLGYVTAQYVKQTEDGKIKRMLAVFVTNDGGHTWTQRSSVSQNLYSTNYVDFVSSNVGFTTCDGGLCVTKDGGQTWQVVQLNEAQENIFDEIDSFDLDFVTELKGWLLTWKIGVGTELYFTDDGGVTWIPLPIQVYRKD